MEILIILLLVMLNAVFAMSEMAIVSSRKARLQQFVDEDRAGAASALALANEPSRFLSTIQVGITTVGVLSGALGEAVVADDFAVAFADVPLIGVYARQIALAAVVVLITYLSVVLGELVPKRVALHNPEAISLLIAQPMHWLSRVSAPLVRVLSWSSEVVLKLLALRASSEPPVTQEEIEVLMEQGMEAGVFEESEQTLVSNILRLDEQRMASIMTPRMDILYLDVDESMEENRQRIVESPYSRLPVCRGGLNNVIGILHAKDLLARELSGKDMDLATNLHTSLYVPSTLTPRGLLETFKKTSNHLALVIDEYGEVLGLATMNDVMEAIVGDIPSEVSEGQPDAVQREDGSWLLDGMLSIDKLREILNIEEEIPEADTGNFHTLAGFVMTQLGKVPKVCDHFQWNGTRFEVMDMDRNRIDKILVIPPKPEPVGGQLHPGSAV